ncbi:cardiolipin synthase [Ectothiorhodospira magna]|uniref:CDP-diacylglycerol--glycerol-3-phosphate 3-phosphatidyltransferase n=1 Tax=Ectothiorhodospira magna TaxID=867345 RepID=A0A1H9F209_9GAMM|nr:CDP-alcohol phosphatidyltransferase family protein [Ectothiorhodospira magna]SEQ31945.1 cardiolipin synthase [Ectothiorhodospira magna]
MNLRQLPNTITLLRIALTGPIIWALATHQYVLVLWLLLVAGLSDGLDGWLVRRYGWYTRLGGYLDPLADKILMMGTYFTVAWTGLLPWWLVAVVVARDLIIVLGAMAFRAMTRSLEMQPLFISKANTFFQIVLVLSVIVNAGVLALPVWYLDGLLLLVLFTTVSSGLAYVLTWGRKAWMHGRSAP